MKKIIAIAMTIILIFINCVLIGTAGISPEIKVADVSALAGETVDVPISFLNNPGINSYSLSFTYDTTRLVLNSVTPEASLGGQFNYAKKAVWVNSVDTDYSGIFLTLHFTVLTDAPSGKASISLSYNSGDICNYDEDDVDFTLTSGCVTVGQGQSKTLTAMSVYQMPNKIEYYVGDTLDTKGLKIKLTYSDGSNEVVSSGFITSGFNSVTMGTKTVTVTYLGKTTEFTVTVNQKPTPPATETKIFMNAVKGRSGEEVNVTFEIEKNPGLAYLKLNVDYDTSVLALVSVTNSGLLQGTFTTSKTISVKPYTLQWMNAADSTENGNFVTLKFKIKDSAAEGDYTVSVQVVEAYNETFDEVAVTTENGTITVKNYIVGDLNDDGVINGKDGILCAQVLADWDVAYNADAADVNGDGVINGKDGILLAQYLADWEVTLG